MGRRNDLIGQKFGMLTVLSYEGNGRWDCICDCGNHKVCRTERLKDGRNRSCGCIRNPVSAGDRFGRLVAKRRIRRADGKSYWVCLCDCGNYCTVEQYSLHTGNTKSCGCLQKERASEAKRLHGMSNTRIHAIWSGIITRCTNKNRKSYKDYGERGIKMCDEWRDDFLSFYNWSMANGYDDSLTIDRIDVNGNYEPSNCRWIPKGEQSKNTRRNRFIERNGETHTLTEWENIMGIRDCCFRSRLRMGWSVEDALFKKVRAKKKSIKCEKES